MVGRYKVDNCGFSTVVLEETSSGCSRWLTKGRLSQKGRGDKMADKRIKSGLKNQMDWLIHVIVKLITVVQ